MNCSIKCSVVSRPSWSKSKSVLTIGTANVFLDVVGLEGAQVVVPVQLKAIKQACGKLGRPMIDVRQPKYMNKSGKWRTSYLSVHLNGAGAEAIEKLIPTDWLRGEIKRLFKTDKAGDYELQEGSWKHLQDREFTTAENAEDEGYLAEVCAVADDLMAKAESKAAATDTKDEKVSSDNAKEALAG